MATMKDIARIAQVSTSTVSHVINNSRFVSEEIRQKVMKVVDELNYRPSALARSLKMKQTKTIGMLVSTSDNPFFAEVVAAVEHYCSQHQYNLLLANTHGDQQRLEANLQTLLQKQVDGLILICSENPLQSQFLNLPLPAVVMDWWPTELNADRVQGNSELGGYLATCNLIERNHRDIAIITGNLGKQLARDRLQGYKRAMQEHGIAIREQWVIESQFNFAGGVKAMQQLLALDSMPSAVFACSDSIAVGAYQAIWQQGLRIPEDISIIGYDDIHLAQYMTPPLTTVHQAKDEFAKQALSVLLERIKNPSRDYINLQLEPYVVLRNSVRVLD